MNSTWLKHHAALMYAHAGTAQLTVLNLISKYEGPSVMQHIVSCCLLLPDEHF